MEWEAIQILKKYFGYDSFRNGQETVINTIMKGRDSVAIMPTGAGKSICYQIPALMLKGITLVISPLISLMQDQVKALNEVGIYAAYINSSLSEQQISKALQYARKGLYKIMYVAPERLDFVVYERQGGRDMPVLAIELDGKEHFEDEVVKKRDEKKNEICRVHNLQIIRVENSYARRYNHIKEILMNYFSIRH